MKRFQRICYTLVASLCTIFFSAASVDAAEPGPAAALEQIDNDVKSMFSGVLWFVVFVFITLLVFGMLGFLIEGNIGFDLYSSWYKSHNFANDAYNQNDSSIHKYKKGYREMSAELSVIFKILDRVYPSEKVNENIREQTVTFNKLIKNLNDSKLARALVQENITANNPTSFISTFNTALTDNEIVNSIIRQYIKNQETSVMNKLLLYIDYLSKLATAANNHEKSIIKREQNMKADEKFNSLFSNFSKIESINENHTYKMPKDNISDKLIFNNKFEF